MRVMLSQLVAAVRWIVGNDATKRKSGVGILDDDGRGGSRRIWQVIVIIVPQVKSKLVNKRGRDRRDHRELREVAGGAVS